jgi:glycosyltransferase involved in cell wall biosynthesis
MLSVIVPTLNRAELLADCLASLTGQTLQTTGFEVIVVDNGSTDNTGLIAESFLDRLPLKYVKACEPGLHIGRHVGMREAASDLLVFCDDDIIADPSWLESIQTAFSDPNIVLLGGNNRPLFEVEPPAWLARLWNMQEPARRALSHLSILDLGAGEFDIDPGLVWGCNFSMRRNVLEDAGGFHPDGMPEKQIKWRGDGETAVTDFIRKSGLRARFHAGASVAHRVPADRMSMIYFKKRSYAQGISDSFADFRRMRRNTVSPTRQLRAVASGLRKMLGAGVDDTGRKLIEVHRNCLSGYISGYSFHQQQLRCDSALRAWVLREDYF